MMTLILRFECIRFESINHFTSRMTSVDKDEYFKIICAVIVVNYGAVECPG